MAETPKTRPSHVLEDPSAQAVARVYAIAYLDAAKSAAVEHPLEELTSFHDDVLERNPQFAQLLTSEMIGRDDKVGLIERAIQPSATPFLANFLKVLGRHERLDLLPLILSEAWQEHERRAGQKRVQIKSAVPLSEEQLASIKSRLHSVLGSEPILLPSVNEELIGGLVIQVGDTVYDGSLSTRLKNLRQRLREGYLNEIQSGRDRFSYPEGN
ncbi:ATP synthase F1 subunit delta [Planctomicrobium sp. SH664]|uniref:ATP synthase F1 subunit delta n=1 Tax=Planctomicrobium sp. SH664 TaxID=3448125 RepID=UPI003F5BBD95